MATSEKDIVLIYIEGVPLSFARIESILPDVKPNWYHVKFLMLQVPLQVVTWILRDVYIDGETFSMNGKEMRLERVVSPEEADTPKEDVSLENQEKPSEKPPAGNAQVISFSDLKKTSS